MEWTLKNGRERFEVLLLASKKQRARADKKVSTTGSERESKQCT